MKIPQFIINWLEKKKILLPKEVNLIDYEMNRLLHPEKVEPIPSVDAVIEDALAHYCQVCKIGFKGRGNKTNHVRLKHKPKIPTND